MKTSLLLERIEKMGNRDIRERAAHDFARAVEIAAGDLEWLAHGDDPKSAAAQVVFEEAPKMKRKLTKVVRDLRSFAKEIRKTQDAIDIPTSANMAWVGKGARV